MLDRRSPLPLWAQLAERLRDEIAGASDPLLPGELELAATYGVSRNTVREALRRLEDEGLVVRERGRKTSVVRRDPDEVAAGVYSLARRLEREGQAERSEVRALDRRRASVAVTQRLGLDRGSEVVYVERVRFAGDDPVAIDRSWLPASAADGLLGLDLTHGSLYDALAVCGVRVTSGTEEVSPVVPTRTDQATLRVAPGDAAFALERLVHAGDRVVELRRSVMRGDRFGFVMVWSHP
jgi:GntR family transcriptional regulator